MQWCRSIPLQQTNNSYDGYTFETRVYVLLVRSSAVHAATELFAELTC
jgi:hypothetical protein